ncbi:hypothetical protein [Rhizobium sp. BK176]|uniref:hypothetical protein n=1 Tax=Rhizobium sp. BK176 TaxID=2587071 RepID=UPI0021699E2A|nr:hypothetical protein [Rhizobium sp. BK176]MCS4088650.1 hypothetical protein [Rhizobium sp. BK176]
MQQPRSIEIVVNGYVEKPVTVHVNPMPREILAILNGPVHELSERTSVVGIVVDDDVYLWDGAVCNVEEFLREWRGDDSHDFDRTFWIEIEDDGEIQVSLDKVLRDTKVFRELAATSKVFFM